MPVLTFEMKTGRYIWARKTKNYRHKSSVALVHRIPMQLWNPLTKKNDDIKIQPPNFITAVKLFYIILSNNRDGMVQQ